MSNEGYTCGNCGMPVKQPNTEIFVYAGVKVLEPVCPNCDERLDISIFDT